MGRSGRICAGAMLLPLLGGCIDLPMATGDMQPARSVETSRGAAAVTTTEVLPSAARERRFAIQVRLDSNLRGGASPSLRAILEAGATETCAGPWTIESFTEYGTEADAGIRCAANRITRVPVPI